jgi:poly-gamma-glutamate capsule biosynthesis protein CapA/YwtB (metallophosphatase superfamily)
MPRMRNATVVVAGDWAPIRAFDACLREEPEAVYGDLLPLLRTADLRIVNCECALTECDKAVWKSGAVFKGEPRHVAGLAAVPFEIACLANNHVLDYGVAGLRETLGVLDEAGVMAVGAGLTDEDAFAPLTFIVDRTKFHIVNFSEGEDLTASHGGPGVFGWEIDRVVETVTRCRKQGGIVIAIGHCGLEYIPYPPPYVAEAFRTIAQAGAHAVIGHHPHVPQGIEWHHGTPIVYSLGNFVFYQQTSLCARKTGFCVRLQFQGDDLARLQLHPYRITDAGLRLLEGRESVDFRRLMAKLSKPLESAEGTEAAWRAYLAYYGVSGFNAEVQRILQRMESEPQKAAAMFRNRITTMQHRKLWQDFLTMVMEGNGPRVPAQARRIIVDYFTRDCSDGRPTRRPRR